MLKDSNRKEILNQILNFNRIENLILRLNDQEIYDRHKDWDFSLIRSVIDFFNDNAIALSEQSHRLADCIINLLSVNENSKNDYFNKFIDLLFSDTRKLDYSKIYFFHFILLSKYRDTGFPNRAEDFKQFYLARYSKIESSYLKYLKEWDNYFLGDRVNEPFSYYTTLFVYDFAKYYPEEYQNKIESLLSNEENLPFFLKNLLSVSSKGEAHRVNGDVMKLLLPEQHKNTFVKKLRNCDTTRLSEEQKQWSDFFLTYVSRELELSKTFTFTNQPIINGYPDKDDHYYEKTFDLNKCDFQVRFKPEIQMEHWRFGVKLSANQIFPAREVRHGSGYPIFHLEKNEKTKDHLYYSYYGESGAQEVGEPTTVQEYFGEDISLVISLIGQTTIIDVFDNSNISILKSPIRISGYKYFKVFAWADSKNQFKFDATFFEKENNT